MQHGCLQNQAPLFDGLPWAGLVFSELGQQLLFKVGQSLKGTALKEDQHTGLTPKSNPTTAPAAFSSLHRAGLQ